MVKNIKTKLSINHQGVIALTLMIFIGFIFSDTSQLYINTWLKFDESMGHALLILVIVVFYLLKPNEAPCNNTRNKAHWLLIIPICLFVIFHQISTFWGIILFQQLSLYFLWLLAVFFILGKSYFKQNIFPLLFFLFAVPFWEFLNPIFLRLTTLAVNNLVDFLPIVAFMDGNIIELPYGILQIAGGCSGLRYFEIGLALSVFAVSSEKFSFRLKFLVVILGAALGVVTNWIRVLSLIWIGYDSKMTSPLMNDHETYGLILFMLVIAPLLFVINWLSKNYALNNKIQEKKLPTTNTNPINKTTWIFLSLFVLSTISTIWLINIEPTNQINTNASQAQKKYPLLSSYGNYKQIITDYTQSKGCNLIIREYHFLEAGKNSLPLNKLYNSNDFYVIVTNVKELPNSKSSAKTNYLLLENKKTKQQTELYYWYKYGEIKITNKYLAKLTEIVFLINKQNKIALNVIACPLQ